MVSNWLFTLSGMVVAIVSVINLWTNRKIHRLVNSNHEEEVQRIDQLTQVIVKSPDVTLPNRELPQNG